MTQCSFRLLLSQIMLAAACITQDPAGAGVAMVGSLFWLGMVFFDARGNDPA